MSTTESTDDEVRVSDLRRRGLKGRLLVLGPAFVAAIAYVDPGNVAANLTAGSRYGYGLLWVLVVANAMAVLVQYLSAALRRAEAGRERPRPEPAASGQARAAG